jgi:hypothetical protein
MIKTELVNQDDHEADLADSSANGKRAAVSLVAIIVGIGFIVGAGILINHNNQGVKQLTGSSAKYANVQALPLGSAINASPLASTLTKNGASQPSSSSGALGSAYTGLQNVPQRKSTTGGSASTLQSGTTAQPSGQTINPNLPY